jgi:hypothetical protein
MLVPKVKGTDLDMFAGRLTKKGRGNRKPRAAKRPAVKSPVTRAKKKVILATGSSNKHEVVAGNSAELPQDVGHDSDWDDMFVDEQDVCEEQAQPEADDEEVTRVWPQTTVKNHGLTQQNRHFELGMRPKTVGQPAPETLARTPILTSTPAGSYGPGTGTARAFSATPARASATPRATTTTTTPRKTKNKTKNMSDEDLTEIDTDSDVEIVSETVLPRDPQPARAAKRHNKVPTMTEDPEEEMEDGDEVEEVAATKNKARRKGNAKAETDKDILIDSDSDYEVGK